MGHVQNVIKRAMIACENSGHSVEDDFPEVRKIVDAGIASKSVEDYYSFYQKNEFCELKIRLPQSHWL